MNLLIKLWKIASESTHISTKQILNLIGSITTSVEVEVKYVKEVDVVTETESLSGVEDVDLSQLEPISAEKITELTSGTILAGLFKIDEFTKKLNYDMYRYIRLLCIYLS